MSDRTSGATVFKRVLHAVLALPVLAAGVWLAWATETKERERTAALDAGRRDVVAADAYEIDPAREGQLVFFDGDVSAKKPLVDPEFGVSVVALGLERVVEMYQWQERTHTEVERTSGGTRKRTSETVYEYEPVWAAYPIDSTGYRDGKNVNPRTFPLAPLKLYARDATLGARAIGPPLLARLDAWVPLGDVGAAASSPEGFVRAGVNMFQRGDPTRPKIGDVRVHYRKLPLGPASFAGRQSGSTLVAHDTPNGPVLVALAGKGATPDTVFELEQERGGDDTIGWVTGLCLLAVGVAILVAPWSAGWPAIALLALAGTVLLGCALAGAVWIGHRPLYAASMFGVVAALVALSYWLARRARAPA